MHYDWHHLLAQDIATKTVFLHSMHCHLVCLMCADACLISPARDASVITVAATTSSDHMPSFSDGGVCVDLLAPGYSILSAYYGSDSGTA